MRMGLSRKIVIPLLTSLLVLTGISIIYSQSLLARRQGQSTHEKTTCFPSPSDEDLELLDPDSITLERLRTLHDYRDDGLLGVSSTDLHPIHDLISRAARQWHVKKNIASSNIQEAVWEYQRRYGRLPPKGFDKW